MKWQWPRCVGRADARSHAGANGRTNPEDVGLSRERLERIDAMIERRIAAGDLTGAVAVVARRGQVAHVSTHGRHGPRHAAADARRHAVPHRLDDEADRRRRHHDDGRGEQAAARRSGVALHPGVPQPDASPSRGPRAAAAPRRASTRVPAAARDHDQGSADARLGARQRPDEQQRRSSRSRARKARRSRTTFRASAARRSSSSPARAGPTAPAPASRRWAACSRSCPACRSTSSSSSASSRRSACGTSRSGRPTRSGRASRRSTARGRSGLDEVDDAERHAVAQRLLPRLGRPLQHGRELRAVRHHARERRRARRRAPALPQVRRDAGRRARARHAAGPAAPAKATA